MSFAIDMELKEFNADFSRVLEKYLPKGGVLCQAAAYGVNSGGKRLRPYILTSVAKALGVEDINIERLAVGLEYVHSYSLVHDDLPAIDNDAIRRGQPSCHAKFGEAFGILAGDALLNSAYEVMLGGTYSENYIKAVSYIAQKSGTRGMLGGQEKDMIQASGKNVSDDIADNLIEMIKGKTSALFQAAMVSPAIYVGADNIIIETLSGAGENFGIAFQLRDDLNDKEDAGNSAVKVFGTLESKSMMIEYCDKVLQSLDALPFELPEIRNLCEYLFK